MGYLIAAGTYVPSLSAAALIVREGIGNPSGPRTGAPEGGVLGIG